MRKEKTAENNIGVAEEQEITVRSMDRNQVKALRKAGLDPAFVVLDAKKTAELIDWVLDNVYPDINFAGIPYYKGNILAMDTYRFTMNGPEEVKNS